MLTENQTPHETAQLKIIWVEKKNQLNDIHRAIGDIDRRLKSWGLAIWEAIGLGPKDVKEEEQLYILPNSKLSKNDLRHKLQLLQYKQEELEGELKSLQATAKQRQLDISAESDRVQDEYLKLEQDQAVELYNRNKSLFFAEVLFDPQVEWAQQKEQIYHNANKIMAVCPLFSSDIDRNHLWQAWKIVARARDIEGLDKTSDIKRYAAGAEKFFRQILSLLPIEMQGLKILYDAKDYDRVDHYLSEVYVTHAIEEDESYAELLDDLIDEINRASQKKSNIVLSNNPQFNKLPKSVKDQLIAQHVYITQARFYLSLVDNAVWASCVKILDENINAVINKRKEPIDSENEFANIKQKIAQNVQEKIKIAKIEIEEDFLRVNAEILNNRKGD